MTMKRLIPTLCMVLGGSLCAKAQLYIDNATFFIESGATVTVQGDLTSNTSIQGTGKILLKGTALQSVNMNNGGAATNAFTIPNLEIDNAANARLTGNVRIGTSLVFTNGKIQTESFNMVLANAATTTGMGDNKFIETNGTGFAQREIGNTAGTGTLPVGAGTRFTPVTLTHSGGTYTNALLSAQAKAGKSPNAHIRTESYTSVYWPMATTGVTGGTLTGTATYPADAVSGFTGTEADIRGMSYNGTVWSLTGGNQDFAANTITAQTAGTSGQIAGMNRFLLLNTRAFLQGAYNSGTGLMSDALRSTDVTQTPGTPSSNNIIPLSDPYRTATYSTSFTHVNNAVPETAAPTVFYHQANPNDNIVDWVYLELRNTATSGNTVLQTRSALVQRDGDIVDIDGISPIYFKNNDAGNYSVGIRHRNHLGIFTDPSTFTQALALAPSSLLNLGTTATTNLMGTAGINFASVSSVNLLYAGNTNSNTTVRFTALNNDKDYLYNMILSGNVGNVLSNVYNQGDLNLNRAVRFTALNNDKDFLYNTVLGSNVGAVKTQSAPL